MTENRPPNGAGPTAEKPSGITTGSGRGPTLELGPATSAVVRRVIVVAVAAAAALLFAWIVGAWLDLWSFGWNRALWIAVSAEIVFAVYKWGVGSWSRYTPPDESEMIGRREPSLPSPNPPVNQPSGATV